MPAAADVNGRHDTTKQGKTIRYETWRVQCHTKSLSITHVRLFPAAVAGNLTQWTQVRVTIVYVLRNSRLSGALGIFLTDEWAVARSRSDGGCRTAAAAARQAAQALNSKKTRRKEWRWRIRSLSSRSKCSREQFHPRSIYLVQDPREVTILRCVCRGCVRACVHACGSLAH